MKKIELKGNNKAPKMVFDLKSGIIKILGRSTMINPQDYYPSIITLIENYCKDPQQKTFLIIDLDYYNTLSAKYLLKIVELMSKIKKQDGCEVKINWYYDSDDLGLKEEINLFSEIIQFRINAVEYELA